MRTVTLVLLSAAMAALCACQKPAAAVDGAPAPRQGRYLGIGIYTPQTQWTKLVASGAPQNTPAARPIDDQAIIVVQDSQTGEIRACGDMTGYCIGMNPWSKPLLPSQVAPINLTEHQLTGEETAAANESAHKHKHLGRKSAAR